MDHAQGGDLASKIEDLLDEVAGETRSKRATCKGRNSQPSSDSQSSADSQSSTSSQSSAYSVAQKRLKKASSKSRDKGDDMRNGE
jgi:hypothetical protein